MAGLDPDGQKYPPVSSRERASDLSVDKDMAEKLAASLAVTHSVTAVRESVRTLVQDILTEPSPISVKEAHLRNIGATGLLPLAEKLPQ